MSNVTSASTLSLILGNIQRQITLYGIPLILFFGIGGNMINCAVFLQKSLRSNSCSIYLIASSIAHTILLILAMSTNLYSVNNIDPLTYSLAYCKIRFYLISSLFMISRTYIVLACVDRYTLCSSHARIRAFSRCQVAFRLIPIVIVAWLIISIYIPILNTIDTNRCIMPGFYRIFYSIYSAICSGILPPSLMITFGLLARRNLRIMRKRIAPAGIAGNQRVIIKKVDYQIMKMVFVEVAIYCISTFPFPITVIYGVITGNMSKSKDHLAIDIMLQFLAGSILQYTTASTALYSNLGTSAVFRHELKKIVMHCIHRHHILEDNITTRPTAAIALRLNGTHDCSAPVQKQKVSPTAIIQSSKRSIDIEEVV